VESIIYIFDLPRRNGTNINEVTDICTYVCVAAVFLSGKFSFELGESNDDNNHYAVNVYGH
jgi:hypothetical protein